MESSIPDSAPNQIRLSLSAVSGTFHTGYTEMDWFQQRITENQYAKLINDLNEAIKPIHKQIITGCKLLKLQDSPKKIWALCVEIQYLCTKLQDEIDQSIYSNEFAFLKNNLQIINQIQYKKMKDVLKDSSITPEMAGDITKGTLFQLYKDGIIIQEAQGNYRGSVINEGIISFNV